MTINLVSAQQVESLEKKLADTDKGGKDYPKIEADLVAAKESFESQKRLIKKAGKKGYRPNPTDGSCVLTGEKIKSNCGFTKKNSYGGWDVFSWSVVQDELER